jgi:hypothetical protein
LSVHIFDPDGFCGQALKGEQLRVAGETSRSQFLESGQTGCGKSSRGRELFSKRS